jgi:nucleoside-diphosphate-sugar epimerase
MKLVLTGAAGKLGTIVYRHLLDAGHTVRATDRKPGSLPVEVADLLEPTAAYRLLDGAEALVHLANHPHFRGTDGQRVFNENVTMNMNVFQAAREVGVKKIVFSSSVQVISGGPPPYVPFDGAMPAQPGNPYALSKQVSETMLAYFARTAGMDCVALRFPWIVNAEAIAHARQHGRWDSRNPHEGFSYVHADDAAALIQAVLGAKLPGYRCYFPTARASGLRQPVADVIREHYAGIPLKRPLDQIESLVDLSTITHETGWSPQFNDW